MDKLYASVPAKKFNECYKISAKNIEAFLDGRVDKETIYIKGNNLSYNDVAVDDSKILAEVTIKSKLKQLGDYKREVDSFFNTHTVTQTDLLKDSFCSRALNIFAHKIEYKEKTDVVIELDNKLKYKLMTDTATIATAMKVCDKLTIGVGLCINTVGNIVTKKNTIKVTDCTNLEIFVKVTTGYNPISKLVELDIEKVLINCRNQMYLLEAELYDIIKMKHLMDIDKQKLMDTKPYYET